MRRIPGVGPDLIEVDPVSGTRGRFFSCFAVSPSGEKLFVKCVPSRAPEAGFWRTWQAGLVRDEGAFYRLVTPLRVVPGKVATVLIFPRHPALPLARRTRARAYRRNYDLAVRALADFNSNHMSSAILGAFRTSTGGGLSRPPRAAELTTLCGLEFEEARSAIAELRLARVRWPAVIERLDGTPRCLSHLDFGRGNVVFEHGKATLVDFGHAAIAPAGADLHTVLRFAPTSVKDDAGRNQLAAIYAAEFERSGPALDPRMARLAMETHFATRYTNPGMPSARPRGAFMAGLETAKALAAAVDAT